MFLLCRRDRDAAAPIWPSLSASAEPADLTANLFWAKVDDPDEGRFSPEVDSVTFSKKDSAMSADCRIVSEGIDDPSALTSSDGSTRCSA